MATPVAQLKKLFMSFLEVEGNFSKLPKEFKKPMLVKVFRTQPLVLIQDKENYVTGYFSSRALKKLDKEYNRPNFELQANTLKIERFTMQFLQVEQGEYCPVTYLNKEIRLVIEEFSFSRPLKKGTDVNRFVANMCNDDDVKLAIAKIVHQKRVKAQNDLTLESYLKNEIKYSAGSAYDDFACVYYGDNPVPKAGKSNRNRINDRLKMPELVTCIVDSEYDPKVSAKGKKRRSMKKEIKDEAVQEAKEDAEELAMVESESENEPTTAAKSAKKARKSRKALKPIQIEYKIEENEVPLIETKMEPEFKTEIEKILQYTKKPKSDPDMDFLKSNDENVKKTMPKPKAKSAKKNRLSHFKEYMEWYDQRCKKGKESVASRGGSTTLSTPMKTSLRISQRIAKVRNVR